MRSYRASSVALTRAAAASRSATARSRSPAIWLRRPASASRSAACRARSSCSAVSASAARRSASATASCASSSAWAAGSSAASASSVAVTAWSFCCSASNASSSGCTSPPHSDLVTRIPLAQLVEHAPLFRDQRRLHLRALEREALVELLQLPLQPARFDPVHRSLVQGVRIAIAQPFGFELLVGARGDLAEREHRVVGDRFEQFAVGDEFELLGVDGLAHPALPWIALEHQEQEGFLSGGRKIGMRDGGCEMRG